MANVKNDFLMVRLTAAGQKMAGEHPLFTSTGRRAFTFTGSEPLKVEKSYEWNAILSKKHTPSGDLMFEIAPAVTPATPTPEAEAAAPESTSPQE